MTGEARLTGGNRPATRSRRGQPGFASRGDPPWHPTPRSSWSPAITTGPTRCGRSRWGAYDFYEKPIDPDLLGMTAARSAPVSHRAGEPPAAECSRIVGARGPDRFQPKCTRSAAQWRSWRPPMYRHRSWAKAALARRCWSRLHNMSDRRDKRLVAINCAAIPRPCSRANCSVGERVHLPVPPRPRPARSKGQWRHVVPR